MLSIDHFVLTVASIDRTCDFYERALGMRRVAFAGRTALAFGDQKINLHPADNPYSPRATLAAPGTGDFCLISDEPVADVAARWREMGIEIIEGPVPRTGARGALTSIYCRDPDGNLVEVANYEVG